MIRWKGCELPTLDDMRERDVYVQMAVTNAKAMEASNEYVALMEKRLADFPSKEEVGGHLLTIQQLQGELEAVQAAEKRREVEIEGAEGQEVRARIEALTEYSEGGFELEEELVRIKDREISLDLDYDVSSVSDLSLSRIDLPEVSGDSVDQE
ncbi:hypothetical protein F2Q68_00029534 [Brassica cretica]|uniref:Uncharacterized protein n=1 Tax=Brassica cretica TaxID=69181 RepID=A0A8S9G9S2_BRACR|nr:hypothetical protein F2Q68_00029534 [Brassica cretica]